MAKYLLGHEREMISGAGGGDRTSAIGAAMLRHAGELDPVLRAELAMFDVDALAYGAMGEKFLDEMKAGKGHPAQPNMMKYVGTELNKRRHELMMSAGGSRAPGMGKRRNRRRQGLAWLVADQSQLHRRRYERSDAERRRQAHSGTAGRLIGSL